MNLNKLTKAQLIEMIQSMQEERLHAQRKDVCKEQPVVVQVHAKTTTHAEIMRERMAAAKAQAMISGRAIKA